MDPHAPETLDGRLNAYRRLLVGLFTQLAEREDGRALIDAILADTETVADHEEDPGVLPDRGFAGQEIANAEIQAVLKAALTRAEARAATGGQARR
ncbi:hypothetical protein [Rhizobium sp. CC-YZS058]|uniref:hypothetical protein n=1 Tax=Rhizobium sp. CC-YZS058 TaxID=3042153 RepID=UPI002B057D65|nr:hypothetical protein [Rhizobium sp. CC-YZS058]MEA3534228.1 hypothetical protein [Rhizobium sp. CC-YZS058]